MKNCADDIATRCKHCSTVTDSGIRLNKFNFRVCFACKMSGTSAKKIVKWHEGWLGEKDANGDLIKRLGAVFRQRTVQVPVLQCGEEVQ